MDGRFGDSRPEDDSIRGDSTGDDALRDDSSEDEPLPDDSRGGDALEDDSFEALLASSLLSLRSVDDANDVK